MWLDKLPKPLQTLIRRIVLRIRIPIYQALSFYSRWHRKWHRLRTSDSTKWNVIDFRTQPKTRVFCISLLDEPRFEPRRQLFQKYARKYDWDFEFWPAVNGSRFKSEPFPEWLGKRAGSDQPMGSGAVGLLWTTKEICEWAAEDDLDYCVLFEDDAMVHSSPKLELPEEFDIVFLNNRVQGDSDGRVKSGWGTDGYIISRRGIQKMLEILKDANAPIDLLILMYTRSLLERGHHMTKYRDPNKELLECYHVGPIVTHASHFDSSIGIVTREALGS